MSTLKVTKLQHPDAASAAVELESDGSIGGFLGDELASKLPYSFGTATPTTTDEGFLWYDSNDTPPAPKFWDGSAFQALTSGKILQVVRATDSTQRSTTSTSYVDITGLSVTITPQKEDSAIILILSLVAASGGQGAYQISDNSNNPISGAEESRFVTQTSNAELGGWVLVGYSTPATTSATTYKARFRQITGTTFAQNQTQTGQIYAIEVSA